ncbi:hypothetical protein H8356DRAFT_1280263 [Neocallimastix lanati (nom. inval.)]|nr:hypothetical protein H8356DRAFT_1280263 [Neocallimastix sp. JGI-2020a]
MEENLIIDIKKIIPKFIYVPNIKKINKCKSFIILNNKKEILKYDSSHNHPEKEYDVSLSIMKHKIKDGIEKSSIPFGIKIKPLYIKISKEMGLIYPEYNLIKSQISRNLYKKLPSNELIVKLNELEHLSYYDYQRKIRGIWKIKKRAINKANEISVLIERYKNIESKLINAKCDRNYIINLWFDCLADLNNII